MANQKTYSGNATLTMDVDLKKVFDSLNRFSKKDRGRIIRPLMRSALSPILAEARAASPVRTGMLKRNIVMKFRIDSKKNWYICRVVAKPYLTGRGLNKWFVPAFVEEDKHYKDGRFVKGVHFLRRAGSKVLQVRDNILSGLLKHKDLWELT